MKPYKVKVKLSTGKVADFGFFARTMQDAIQIANELFGAENILSIPKDFEIDTV